MRATKTAKKRADNAALRKELGEANAKIAALEKERRPGVSGSPSAVGNERYAWRVVQRHDAS